MVLHHTSCNVGIRIARADAAWFAIGAGVEDLISILFRTDLTRDEIAKKLWAGLTATDSSKRWNLPVMTSIKRHAHNDEDAGGWVVLTWLSN